MASARLNVVWRTVGKEQHISLYIAGAIVGYDEIAFGGGL